MRLLLVLLSLLFATVNHAQDEMAEEVEYLDTFLKGCKKRHAEFIRKVERNGTGRFMATTVSVYGDTVFIGEYSDPSCTTPHGRFAYFHDNGQIESKGYYSSSRKVGTWRHWKRDGSSKPSIKYSMDVPEDMIAVEKKEIEERNAEEAQMANADAIAAAEAAMQAAQEAESRELNEAALVGESTAGNGSEQSADGINADLAENLPSSDLESSDAYEARSIPQPGIEGASQEAVKGEQPSELNRASASPLKTRAIKMHNFGLPMVW